MNIVVNPNTTKKYKTGGWRTFKPKIDLEKCLGCGMCSNVCPEGIIEMKKNKNNLSRPNINYDYCKGCGVCASECPVKGIIMELEKK